MVQFTAHATDPLGASSQASSTASVSGTPRGTQTNTYTLFDTTVPGTLQNDNTANELGLKFYLSNNATCTGVRFYKPVGATGTHVGSLWTTSGTLLAQDTFTNETASGWQTLTFASPVQLTAGTPYMVSYGVPANSGKYYADTTGKVQHTELTNGIIHAIAAGDPTPGFSGGNGAYGTIGTFPNHGIGVGTLYGVDVVLSQTSTIFTPIGPEYYDRWPHTIPSDPTFFPIGVWLQEPLTSAPQYKAMGINMYVSLWAWPPDTGQVKAIRDAGMYLMAGGNDANTTQAGPRFTITNADTQAVLRSYHVGDEFDMTGGTVTPAILQTYVNAIRKLDSSRPIHANFGTPTAYENAAYGGVKDVDIPQYLNTVDIISCDMYGNTLIDNKTGQVFGTWIYGHGIDRMRNYTQDQKPCWGFLETSMPNSGNSNAPSPQQVYNTAWMLITHGARGLIYFVHKFWPPIDSASLLHDSTMGAMVTTINTMIANLAPVINGPTKTGLLTVQSSNTTAGPVYGVTGVPIDTMVKVYGGDTYVFSIGGRPGTTTGTFTLSGVGSATATVIGENRTIPITNGTWTDNFTDDYQPHIYQINAVAS